MNNITAYKVRRLIAKPYAVTINVSPQTNELLEVIPLFNNLKDNDENAGDSSHKLYPILPAY